MFHLLKNLVFEVNMINYYPKLPTFKSWAEDTAHDSELEVFRSVCQTINPIIPELCTRFGYPGYLKIVESLIIFFGDGYLSTDEVQELFQIFPVLHDAGLAATSPVTLISFELLAGLEHVRCVEEINANFIEELFSTCSLIAAK